MNRYEQQGIAVDLSQGRTVLVCADSVYAHHIATTMLDLLDDIANDGHPDLTPAPELEVARAIKSYGCERIEVASGGRLVFARSIDAMRGHTADRVLISTRVRESPGYMAAMDSWLGNARLATRGRQGSSIEHLSG